jgi:RNA polymerase sigma-70 factor (ECF subfamily)
MTDKEIIPHLFRTEYGKLVSVLSGKFGLEHIDLAEDIASEAFLAAMDSWPYKGMPGNPVAWLHRVARNKFINHLNRASTFQRNVAGKIRPEIIGNIDADIDLSGQHIRDSQLRMLFTICHPSIAETSQVSLALRILCGFGIQEIADAFMLSTETIAKRLQRAKEKLRSEDIQIDLPDDGQVKVRLDSVLRTIYLLFSEGYYSESHEAVIRKDLCLEAMNLAYLLLETDLTNTHEANSLMSLMCFHASRLESRLSENNELILYDEQDENRWNTELIEKGFYYLQQASKWEIRSKYYLEACIAYWHTVKTNAVEKWDRILGLYDLLVSLDASPIVALNRLYALSKARGKQVAMEEALKLDLKNSHFYFILLADLCKEHDPKSALDYLAMALRLCKTGAEKKFIHRKMDLIANIP